MGKSSKSSQEMKTTNKDYIASTTTQKQYFGNLSKSNQCYYHHFGEWGDLHYQHCNKKGHTNKDYQTNMSGSNRCATNATSIT